MVDRNRYALSGPRDSTNSGSHAKADSGIVELIVPGVNEEQPVVVALLSLLAG